MSTFAAVERKPSALSGIVRMRCPYCRQGRFYVSHPYDLEHAGDVLDECPVCHRDYNIEYGFYMGAMYLSYGMSIIIGFAAFLLTTWLLPSLFLPWRIAIVAGSVLLAAPLVYAYSKVIYGYIFIPYKGPADPNYLPRERRPDRWR